MIVKTKQGYQVRSESGRNLSKPNLTKRQAQQRLAQVERFKAMKKWGINMKDLLVAIAYQGDKTCKEIYKVMNIDKQEFQRLVNEKNRNKDLELQQLAAREKTINDLKSKVDKREFILAKSIYDNFVDRGFIEDNPDFQQMFYAHIFNDAQYDITLVPQEFITILDYLGRL